MTRDINPHRTRLSLTIVGWLVLLGVVFTAGARANNYLRDIRDDVAAVRASVWTSRQQERWAVQLERDNRQIGLRVPEPSAYKPN